MSESADVFLSYAPADREAASSLARSLTNDGFSVWTEDNLQPGTDRFDAIGRARFFLMLSSDEFWKDRRLEALVKQALYQNTFSAAALLSSRATRTCVEIAVDKPANSSWIRDVAGVE